jgi:hypothetical protein
VGVRDLIKKHKKFLYLDQQGLKSSKQTSSFYGGFIMYEWIFIWLW